MARRRRQAASRAVTFGPGLILPGWGWDAAGKPLHLIGLGTMTVLGAGLWPLLIIAALFAPSCRMALVPRKWRRKYRNRADHWWWRNRGRNYQRSSRITQFLRRVVWSADRFQCVACRHLPVRERHDLEGDLDVDHFCPWILGGLTALPNLLTLCGYHNTIKSYYWRDRNGYEHYRGRDPRSIRNAAKIAAIERQARRDPRRWWRAAWALGA